jgi:predicted dehydrogenase
MTETSLQARQLVETAEKKKLVLHVDHTFIYTGAVKKMKDLVASDDLGKILYYDSTRVNLGLFQRDVSVISDLAVHDFSILDYLLEEQPTAVSAGGINHFPGTPENLAYITMFYDSGAIAHVTFRFCDAFMIPSLRRRPCPLRVLLRRRPSLPSSTRRGRLDPRRGERLRYR